MTERKPLAALLAAAALFSVAPAAAQAPDLVSHNELRICADPSNMPLSDDKREGFENKVADIIGRDLNVPVTYVWFPQVVGFVRNTLRKDECDLVMGTVSGDELMENTNPYYHTGYMIVTRADAGIDAHDLSAPVFADKRIGLIAATPPTDILVRHDMMEHVTSYPLVIDTRFDSSARQMIQDLVEKKIDVALLWGPFAGYYIKHDNLPLKAAFLTSDGPERLDFHIAMGVRANEADWRRRINQAIIRHQDEITHTLQDFGVPLLDEQNHPIEPTGPGQ